jgi:hypothetical protein
MGISIHMCVVGTYLTIRNYIEYHFWRPHHSLPPSLIKMALSREEAADLARQCVPLMRERSNLSIPTDLERSLTEKDVQVQNKCRLWAGMGFIYTISFHNYIIVVKRIMPPPKERQSFGDRRKAVSYEVEAAFYENVALDLVNGGLSIPVPFLVQRDGGQITICMSYLEGRGGPYNDSETYAVLSWLAQLHAATWGEKADQLVCGLQPIGSYWHLDTRPDEHDSMARRGWEGRLKLAAKAIDERLKRDNMQCCIHGDAKDANMLFSGKGERCTVSMYDFQYYGKAPPAVDLAYFLCVGVGSTDEDGELLKYYHKELLNRLAPGSPRPSLVELKDSLALAFCDFQRFMSGWGNWGCDLSDIVRQTLDRLDGGKQLTEDGYRDAVTRVFG